MSERRRGCSSATTSRQILRALQGHPARRRLRGRSRPTTAEEALDRAAVRPPDAAIIDLVLPDGDGVEVCRRLREWTRCRSSCSRAVGEEDAEGPRAGGRRRRLRDQAVRRRASWSPGSQAALRRAGDAPGEPAIEADGLEIDLAAPRRAPRRRGGPPDADRVRPAARARAQPRPADDPPRAARRGLGPAVRATTPRSCAPTSPTCAARSSRPASAALHPHRPGRRLPLRRLSDDLGGAGRRQAGSFTKSSCRCARSPRRLRARLISLHGAYRRRPARGQRARAVKRTPGAAATMSAGRGKPAAYQAHAERGRPQAGSEGRRGHRRPSPEREAAGSEAGLQRGGAQAWLLGAADTGHQGDRV